MSKQSVLERISVILPIHAGCSCSRGSILNLLYINVTEESSFREEWGEGNEDLSTDTCPDCAELGQLEKSMPFFFVNSETSNPAITDCIVAFRMSLDLIEAMNRLLQDYKDDRRDGERVFLASDAMCDCDQGFHIFRLDETNNDFSNDWNFEKHPFFERNKVVQVSAKGVCFACDLYSSDGKSSFGTIRSCWFSVEDLAEINTLLVSRGIESARANSEE